MTYKYGKFFLLITKDIFQNRNKTFFSLINEYIDNLEKGIENQSINSKINYNYESGHFDYNISCCSLENIKSILNETYNLIEFKNNNSKTPIHNEDSFKQIIRQITKDIYSEVIQKNKENKRIKANGKKLTKLFKKDFLYYWNMHINSDTQINEIIKNIKKIIKDKLNIIKKDNFNVLNPNMYIENLDKYNINQKIEIHNIFKLYRNLSSVVGMIILKYNLKHNNKFYDFGKRYEKRREVINKEYSVKLAAINLFRNVILHQRTFALSDFNEKNLEFNDAQYLLNNFNESETLLEEKEKNWEQNIQNIWNNHKIVDNNFKNIKIYSDISITPKFKHIFKITKNNKDFEEIFSLEQITEKCSAQKFILKQLFYNDFQFWLKEELNEKSKIVKMHEKFKKLYTNQNKRYELNIDIPDNISELNIEINTKISTLISQKKEEDKIKLAKKIQNLFWSFVFNEFLFKNNLFYKILKIKLNLDNHDNNFEFKVNMDNYNLKPNKDFDWLINIFEELSLEELIMTKNYFNNYNIRMFSKTNVSSLINIKKTYNVLNKNNIMHILNLITLEINSRKPLNIDSQIDTIDNLKKIFEFTKDHEELLNNKEYKKNSMLQNLIYIDNYMNNQIYKPYIDNLLSKKITKMKIFESKQNVNDLDVIDKIKITSKNNYNNGASLLNVLNFIKKFHYWTIRWCMYREFYYNVESNNKLYRLLECIKNLEKINSDKPDPKIINKVNKPLAFNLFKNYFGLEVYDVIQTELVCLKKLIDEIANENAINCKKSVNNIVSKYNEIIEIYKSIEPNNIEIELIKYTDDTKSIKKNTYNLNMHFEEIKKEKFELLRRLNMLRSAHDTSRHMKNRILPSFIKLLDNESVIFKTTLNEHDLVEEKTFFRSKQIEVKDNRIKINLINTDELKLFEYLIIRNNNNEK